VSEDERLPSPAALTTLATGEVELEGRMPWSSNATFLATVCHGEDRRAAVYKPYRGERPLWDFPDGLYRREVAAYEVSAALGWGVVPETVLREDAPLGLGSLQRFVDADFAQHYFTLLEDECWHDDLRRMAVFDLVVNNADRKGGHCLLAEGRVWGIDNGLCFHTQSKLRTVIWDFGGTDIPDELRGDLHRLAADPPQTLEELLNPAEVAALARRAEAAARMATFPDPEPNSRAYPWPLV
jgi:uncharacterized repeat protein (TIGR03843 family)